MCEHLQSLLGRAAACVFSSELIELLDGLRSCYRASIHAVAGGVLAAVSAVNAFRVVHTMFSTVSAPIIGAAAVAVALLTVAMSLATWIPARRAARLDPAALLREE